MSSRPFFVVSSWHCHCKNLPGLFDKHDTSSGWLLVFGPRSTS